MAQPSAHLIHRSLKTRLPVATSSSFQTKTTTPIVRCYYTSVLSLLRKSTTQITKRTTTNVLSSSYQHEKNTPTNKFYDVICGNSRVKKQHFSTDDKNNNNTNDNKNYNQRLIQYSNDRSQQTNFSLRRPPDAASLFNQQSQNPSNNLMEDYDGSGMYQRQQTNPLIHHGRPNAVTLFPGSDYNDDDDDDEYNYSSNWEDDNEYDFFNNDGERDPEEVAYEEEAEPLFRSMQKHENETKAIKQRWIEFGTAPNRTSVIDEYGRSYGRGSRKTASARVWIQPGFGEIVVNKRPFVEYFDRFTDRDMILEPLVCTETCTDFDIVCMVEGGGVTGQAGAIRLGLANALNHYNPDLYRIPLKKLQLLTRDSRKVERKKIGHKKARKSPQWVRR